MSIEAKQATPHNTLIGELMDSRIPKTEREHAAAREIERLRQAIEQAEQAQPKCGAIIEVFGKDWRLEYMNLPVGRHKLYTQQYEYTAPPPRQPWVGLTAEEIWQCNTAPAGHHVECHICVAHQNVLDFAEAIEAKLKEKNKW
jgi:hypothetical protein